MSQTSQNFDSLGLADPLLKALVESGYTTPTPIQSKAIPRVLEGKDVLAAAQTGTGKTAGFTLPILNHLIENNIGKPKPGIPRCLILTPTRELAAQIGASVQVYGKHLPFRSSVVFGGVNIERQIRDLRKPVDIVIATPGRLLDLVQRRNIDLSAVEILVLDEADRMLDMGFIHDVKRITKITPNDRQTLLFSATFSEQIRQLARGMLVSPAEVSVAAKNTTTELVQQRAHYVDKPNKRALLSHLIIENNWDQVLIFTKTKHGANRLTEQLGKDGIKAGAIHGNKSQAARTRALAEFKEGKIRALVATDIAARGIDIHQLPQVVNYELPLVAEDYVHRIGRTGRAGSNGQAVSLVDAEEVRLLAAIERLIKQKVEIVAVDGFTVDVHPVVKAKSPQRSDRSRRGGNKPSGGKKKGSSKKRNHRAADKQGNRSGNRSNDTSTGRSKKRSQRRRPKTSANS